MRVEFIKEGLTFTGEDTPMANLMLSVMGAFAEFERYAEFGIAFVMPRARLCRVGGS
jgi:hypothetical protein